MALKRIRAGEPAQGLERLARDVLAVGHAVHGVRERAVVGVAEAERGAAHLRGDDLARIEGTVERGPRGGEEVARERRGRRPGASWHRVPRRLAVRSISEPGGEDLVRRVLRDAEAPAR